jgi:hypothetical protein
MTRFTSEFHATIARETLIVRQNNRHGQVLFTVPVKHINQDYNLSVSGSALVLNTLPYSRKILYTTYSPESAEQLINAIAGALTTSRCGIWLRLAGVVLFIAVTLAFMTCALKTLSGTPLVRSPVTVHQAAPTTRQPLPLNNPGRPVPPPAETRRRMRATELSRATTDGHYTIALSRGHARTLFVFADPACPNCKIFEPALQGLSQTFNVEIFPVTLVGHNATVRQVAPILCQPPAGRAALWTKLFDISAGVMEMGKAPTATPSAPCQAGIDAVARNNLGFSKYQLPGTPIVIADDGRLVPFDALTSDTALTAFLNTPVQ